MAVETALSALLRAGGIRQQTARKIDAVLDAVMPPGGRSDDVARALLLLIGRSTDLGDHRSSDAIRDRVDRTVSDAIDTLKRELPWVDPTAPEVAEQSGAQD